MNAEGVDHLHSDFTVTPVHPAFGAEIGNVDLSRPLSAEQCKAIRALWVRHKVIFFRDQELTPDQFEAFASNFGQLDVYPSPTKGVFTTISRLSYGPENRTRGTDEWHSDTSGWETPCSAVVLRALEVPTVGGDTLFADMGAAYLGLSEDIKSRIDGLTAIHDEMGYGVYLSKERQEFLAREFPPREHPIVRTHPETGEKILFVNRLLTTRIVGLPKREGKELLDYLCAQAAVPEYQIRFHWRNNSIAFWDNRSTQHYASADFWPAVRRMERISISGDKPY